MTIKASAFLALEASLALRMTSTLKALTDDLYVNIGKFLKDKNWEPAERLMRGLDLTPVFDLNKDYIVYLSHISVLFGASRVTSTPGTSVVGLGFERETVKAMVDAFRYAIQLNLTEAMINSGVQLIALERQREEAPSVTGSAYLGTVLKAAKPSAILPFESFMDKNGKAIFKAASSLHTSRLASFGYTAEAEFLGITEYQINEQLDGRICRVCAMMHGKVFKVADARSLLNTVIRTQDPDELKSMQPWPSQTKDALADMEKLTAEEIVSRGWHVPPFHPHCRGFLSKSGKAPKLTPGLPAKDVPETYLSTKEDFAQLGINLSPQKINLWNTLMQTSPAEVVAKLSGTTQDSLLASIMGQDDPQSLLGLANLSVTKTGVNIELQKSVFGSKSPVTQDYYFRKDQSLFVGLIKMAEEDAPLLKLVLKNLYGTAKPTAMKKITMVADEDISGYAWAKYGLSLSPRQWGLVKRQIRGTPYKMGLVDNAPAVEGKAFEAIMASPDPKDIFALADLPSLGKEMLTGTTWNGSLDFEDSESMTRFISAMGGTS